MNAELRELVRELRANSAGLLNELTVTRAERLDWADAIEAALTQEEVGARVGTVPFVQPVDNPPLYATPSSAATVNPRIDYGAIAGMLKQLAKISAGENDRGVSFRASHIGAQAAACEAMIGTTVTVDLLHELPANIDYRDKSEWTPEYVNGFNDALTICRQVVTAALRGGEGA